MRLSILMIAGCLGLCGAGCSSSPKVVKVLPTYLDLDGQTMRDPSLFERDAYQAYLRTHPIERNGVQFDIQWRAPGAAQPKILVDMRGSFSNRLTTAHLELPLKGGGRFSHWSKTALTSGDFAKFGDLTAWHVTLWDGNTQLAEQKSFLW